MNPTFESRPSTTMHSLVTSHRIHVGNWAPLTTEVEMDYTITPDLVDVSGVESQLLRACQRQLQMLLGNENHISVHGTPINKETTHIDLSLDPEFKTSIQAACETQVNILSQRAWIPCVCKSYPSTFDLCGDYGSSTCIETKVYVAYQDHVDDSSPPPDSTVQANLIDGIPEVYQEKIDKYLEEMSRAPWFRDNDKRDVKEGLIYDEPVLEIEGRSNAVLLKYRVTAKDRDNLLEVLGRAFWGDLLIGCCLMSLFMFFWGGLISVVIYGARIKKLVTKFREPTNASDAFDAYKSYATSRNDDYMTFAIVAPTGSILVFFATGLFTSQFFATHPLLLIIVSVVFLFIAGPASFIFPAMVMTA